MSKDLQLTLYEARQLLEAVVLRMRVSRQGLIRIDEAEAKAIELILEVQLHEMAADIDADNGEEQEPQVDEQDVSSFAQAIAADNESAPLPELELDFECLVTAEDIAIEARCCIDFGTAMTKAFAMRDWGEPVELNIGELAGADHPFMVDSSVLLKDEKIFFGPDALRESDDLPDGRRRFDSMKTRIIECVEQRPPAQVVEEDLNPECGEIDFTDVGLLALYLAYIDRLVGDALEKQGLPRNLKKRIARPCWSGETGNLASTMVKRLIAIATILSATLGDELYGGLPTDVAAAALSKISEIEESDLDTAVECLIEGDIS